MSSQLNDTAQKRQLIIRGTTAPIAETIYNPPCNFILASEASVRLSTVDLLTSNSIASWALKLSTNFFLKYIAAQL